VVLAVEYQSRSGQKVRVGNMAHKQVENLPVWSRRNVLQVIMMNSCMSTTKRFSLCPTVIPAQL